MMDTTKQTFQEKNMSSEAAINTENFKVNWETCLSVLNNIKDDTDLIPENQKRQFIQIIRKISNTRKKKTQEVKKEQKRAVRKAQKLKDSVLIGHTTLVQREPLDELNPEQKRLLPPLNPEEPRLLHKPKKCYVCKTSYRRVHHFYHSHCPVCADRDFKKRTSRTDLKGYRALITGGRIKIGYETALKLLRDGADVIVTSRFPKDSARRYQQEQDFEQWKERLTIYGLDLKNIPAVEAFTRHLRKKLPSLEILINNAAQTIRRPEQFYAHLTAGENETLNQNGERLVGSFNHFGKEGQPLLLRGTTNDIINQSHFFPVGKLDKDGQQVDLRPSNTWNTHLSDVDLIEMLEVQLINVTAPFLLNSRLKPLFLASSFPKKFIINVSAMEGQFNRATKTKYHPHTNMAKASLNMMSRTSGQDYAKDGIYMNSVDTGWVTQEHPYHIRTALHKQGIVPPLDCIDGASRVYDPIVTGLKQDQPVFGKFIKDYEVGEW